MSENTVNNALRVMGYDTKTEICHHGFRTMARGAMGNLGFGLMVLLKGSLATWKETTLKRLTYTHHII